MSDITMLNNLLRIQLAFQNDDVAGYEVAANANGFFLNVSEDNRSEFMERYGDYPVYIGDSFEEARAWLLNEFGAYV